MQELNKVLTEVMGECWHEPVITSVSPLCIKCGSLPNNQNFSTWEGFGKLWEWSQKQKWFDDFQESILHSRSQNSIGIGLVNPKVYAEVVCYYLKEKT